MSTSLLRYENFSLSFGTGRREKFAVREISLEIGVGERIALVGESGSGKSVTALAILGLIARPFGRVSGQIDYDSKDLLTLDTPALQKISKNASQCIEMEKVPYTFELDSPFLLCTPKNTATDHARPNVKWK